ncbi:MAG: DUF5615 family PIN-like protein [Pseudomonadota bacterium]
MKLLLDQNLSYRLLDALQTSYPESAQIRLLGMAQSNDAIIWRYAKEHDYTIVTKDSDFYEYGLLFNFPPKVIWMKCGNTSTQYIANLLTKNHAVIQEFLQNKQDACLELY